MATKPRREALSWALKLFREEKSRADMDAAIERSQKDKDPRAQAVRHCWTAGREWVNEQLKAGKNYEEIKELLQAASSAEDKRWAPVRSACLAEIRIEGHTQPQHSGCDEVPRGGIEKSSIVAASSILS